MPTMPGPTRPGTPGIRPSLNPNQQTNQMGGARPSLPGGGGARPSQPPAWTGNSGQFNPFSNGSATANSDTSGGRGAWGEFFLGQTYDPSKRPEAFQLQGAEQLAGQYSNITGMGQSSAPQLQNIATQLGNIASGDIQGAGELAVQRQAERAIAQQRAMAAQPGYGAVGAGRTAARNVAQIGADVAGQAQRAAMEDQQRARIQQAQILQQQQQAQLQALAGQTGLSQAELQARLVREQMLAGDAASSQGIIGGLISGTAQVASAALS